VGIHLPGAAPLNLRGDGGGPALGPPGAPQGQNQPGDVGSRAQDQQGNVGPLAQDQQGNVGPLAQGQGPMAGGPPGGDRSKVESRVDPLGSTKLLDGHLGVAIGWLFPLTLLSLLFGLWWRRGTARTEPVRGGLVMWGVWLAMYAFVYSAGAVDHTAFVATLAPAIAALSALGIVSFGQEYRRGGRRAWVLPLAVATNLAWGVWLWSHFPNFLPWARWGTLALGVVALLVLILARVRRTGSTALVTAGLVLGVAAMLAAPATYAISVLDPDYSGSSFDANAGPASGSA
jgi:4-amino-4-deoxy-L-arabinose transferase-like glycosyltransferase